MTDKESPKYGKLSRYITDPLYKNSFYLTLNRVFNAGTGLVFWVVAAWFYSVSDIGIASALISSLAIVMHFSRFGFDFTMIRYISHYDKSDLFSTCIMLTTLGTFIVAPLYLVSIDYISPSISFLKDYALIFIAIAVLNSVTLSSGNGFLALRMAELKFYQNVLLGLRIPFLLPFMVSGSLGILFATGLAYLVSTAAAMYQMMKYLTIKIKINWNIVKETYHFSSMNYIGNLFLFLPVRFIPIIALNLLGAEEAGVLFIVMTLIAMLFIIPEAMSFSLFVEGSHGENLVKTTYKALGATYAVVLPAVVIFFFFGDIFLGWFGPEYANGFDLLRIMSISTLFAVIHYFFVPIQNIRMKLGSVVLINFIYCILLVGLGYFFMSEFGIIGLGYAYNLTFIALGLISAIFAMRVIRSGKII
jgi:O-antigen/teichoic acid export membrane protein